MSVIGSSIYIVVVFAIFAVALLLLTVFVLVPVTNHVSRKLKIHEKHHIKMDRNRVLTQGLIATGVIAVLLIIILVVFSRSLGL